jgi:hypothetical protein
MKRFSAIAGMLVLAALGICAAVWDGSAVAGVAGDFPGDGLYGACNSFPRDTTVTVTNLENGKTVTVTVTRGVENPGVFIALSPKAAAALGMQAGASARIRAEALTASQAETSLPPTRAGETADPDYNPKVFVERDRAAAKAAAVASAAKTAETAPPAAVAPPPAAAATPAATAPAIATAPATAPAAATAPAVAAAPSAPKPEASAEILSKTAEPQKLAPSPLPTLTEPSPNPPAAAAAAAQPAPALAAATPATPSSTPAPAQPAQSAQPPAPKLRPDNIPLPATAYTFPGSPKQGPLAMSMPTPDLPSIPPAVATSPTAHGGDISLAPEIVGGTELHPRKALQPRIVFTEPTLPQAAVAQAKAPAQPKPSDKASVDALSRPAAASLPGAKTALAEPSVGQLFGPDQLPDAVMSRVVAPVNVSPSPRLAEAPAPSGSESANSLVEAIGLDKPSYAAEVEASLADANPPSPTEASSLARPARSASQGGVAELAEAELPGSPEALAMREAAVPGLAQAELQSPELPTPSESLAKAQPKRVQVGESLAALDEPESATPYDTGTAATAIADALPGPAQPAQPSLGEPEVLQPSDTLVAGRPTAVAPGQALAELAEPTSVPPLAAVATGPEAAVAERPALAPLAPSAELAAPTVPSPTESIADVKPSPPAPGETKVTLEPAAPRPPQAAAAAPAVPSAPTAPAAVAVVKGPTPAGAIQAPGSIPMLKGLAKGSFYVQIGVYGTNDSLQSAIAGIKKTYPLAVESLVTKSGSKAFRLYVGPLSRDESGVVLIRLRSLGFKDAYVRQGS